MCACACERWQTFLQYSSLHLGDCFGGKALPGASVSCLIHVVMSREDELCFWECVEVGSARVGMRQGVEEGCEGGMRQGWRRDARIRKGIV